ncbi:TPA: hypothetical protein QDE50_00460 [Burkholderia cenocepacia]|nr:hypothetical protein [Burkholderia cenocepacia]HDR9885104.1 hypothetical protein [Burkholderia cenocepacia]
MRIRVALLHIGRQLHTRIRHVTRQVLRVLPEARHASLELIDLTQPQILRLLKQGVVEQPLVCLLAVDPLQLGCEVLRVHRVHVVRQPLRAVRRELRPALNTIASGLRQALFLVRVVVRLVMNGLLLVLIQLTVETIDRCACQRTGPATHERTRANS